MISWIKGEIISSWLQNQKLFLLINCQGIGYEIQALNSVENDSNTKNITLWIEHIKREDSEFLFGFIQKEERDFFRDLLKVKGIGPQIGMALLNKFSIVEVKKSLMDQNKDLISCQGVGYEIQTLKNVKDDSNKKNITLWIEHIKREDSDFLFGFVQKDERDFFRDLLKVRGIGPQIGMSLLNKYSLNDVKTSLLKENKDLISSVPGIGKKMTERIFLELKNKITLIGENSNKKLNQNYSNEMTLILKDIDIALRSLDYPIKDIKIAINTLTYDFSKKDPAELIEDKINFENILKKAISILENNDSKFG